MLNPYKAAETINNEINVIMNDVPNTWNWSYIERLNFIRTIKTTCEVWEQLVKNQMKKDK